MVLHEILSFNYAFNSVPYALSMATTNWWHVIKCLFIYILKVEIDTKGFIILFYFYLFYSMIPPTSVTWKKALNTFINGIIEKCITLCPSNISVLCSLWKPFLQRAGSLPLLPTANVFPYRRAREQMGGCMISPLLRKKALKTQNGNWDF